MSGELDQVEHETVMVIAGQPITRQQSEGFTRIIAAYKLQ